MWNSREFQGLVFMWRALKSVWEEFDELGTAGWVVDAVGEEKREGNRRKEVSMPTRDLPFFLDAYIA